MGGDLSAGSPGYRLSRRGVLGAAAGVAAGALAGCSTGSSGGELVVGYFGDANELASKAQLITEFARRHPKIKVRATYADSSGFFEKLPLLFRSGAAPDAFFAAESWISGLAPLGGYTDVRSRMSADGLTRDQWIPGSFRGVDVGSHTWGLPVSVYPRGVAYNETLFKKRGVSLPQAGWSEQDWVEKAKALTHGSGTSRIWGTTQFTGGGTLPPYDLVTLYGGMIFDIVTRKMSATESSVVRAVAFVQDWLRTWKIAPPATSSTALAAGLPSGLYGMDQFPGYNSVPYTAEIGNSFAWGVAPFPTEWRGTFQNTNVCVFAGSHRKDDAWTFAKWVATDPDAQALQGRAATPVAVEAAKAWIAKPPVGFSHVDWAPLVARLDQAGVAYQGGEFNKVWEVMNNENERVQLQGATPAQAMAELQSRGREILAV